MEEEARIDKLLEQFAYRFERTLEDLTPAQTERLVRRLLEGDPDGQTVLLSLLNRIFREADSGASLALSGKPVIISYLLEVLEALKEDDASSSVREAVLTEWEVYRLIVDKLMLRDFRRAPELAPEERRAFLWRLSVVLSGRDTPILGEAPFRDLVAQEFNAVLRRVHAEERRQELERLFADLRSSTTLTRSSEGGRTGWRFSHNSLREYLVSEYLLRAMANGSAAPEELVISDAMRLFVASRSDTDRRKLLTQLSTLWKRSNGQRGLGQLLTLLWDAIVPLFGSKEVPAVAALSAVSGPELRFDEIRLHRLVLSSESRPLAIVDAHFRGARLTEVVLSAAILRRVDFTDATLESVNLDGADLEGALFSRALLVDVGLSGTNLTQADFRGVDPEYTSILVETEHGTRRLEGLEAVGYLGYHGATIDTISNAYVLCHHPRYQIVQKVLSRLAEQTTRQRRGLEQRGAAQMDVPFARRLVALLEQAGWIATPLHRRELVEVTGPGREVFATFVETGELPAQLAELLRPT